MSGNDNTGNANDSGASLSPSIESIITPRQQPSSTTSPIANQYPDPSQFLNGAAAQSNQIANIWPIPTSSISMQMDPLISSPQSTSYVSSNAGTRTTITWHTPSPYQFPAASSSATSSSNDVCSSSTVDANVRYPPVGAHLNTAATGFTVGWNGFNSNHYNNMPNVFNYANNPSGVPTATATTASAATPMVNGYPFSSNAPTMKVSKRLIWCDLNSLPKRPRGRPPKNYDGYTLGQLVAEKSNLAPKGPTAMIRGPKRMPAAATTATTWAALSKATTWALPSPIPNTDPLTASQTNATDCANARPTVTARIPTPPNWLKNCEDTVMSLFTFKTYSISHETDEYKTIAKMLYPIQVDEIEQIVNPELWKRFVNTRTDMLRSKNDDIKILSKLGLDDTEVARCLHFAENYDKDQSIVPYSDNMVLLFHCTRSLTSLNNILSQGLDERLSNISGGLLGKGIYFSDDPNKCIQYDGTGYILIFAVLLGDCISVDHLRDKHGLVREPEKVSLQKRNSNDQFFDSIVARPAGYNEYVIYNRYQCCPIYQVKYVRSVAQAALFSSFHSASLKLPPIAWMLQRQSCPMPIQGQTIDWPPFAVNIFTEMGVPPPKDDESTNEDLNIGFMENHQPEPSINDELAKLIDMGFHDEDKNREILSRYNNDFQRALNFILDSENAVVEENNQSSTSTATINSSPQQIAMPSTSIERQSIVTIDLIDDDSDNETMNLNDSTPSKIESDTNLPEDIADWALENDPSMEDCPICCDEFQSYENSPSAWKLLECSHKLCRACYSSLLTTRSTMSGEQHTFVKCPFCQGTTGAEIGTCPDMQMNVSVQPYSCAGFEASTTIAINYVGQNFDRTAYLPNNDDGQEVLRLLRIAFDRRICFTVGTSNTTGQENVIVWNIHHKTSFHGGVSSYGFPDPGYLDRVKWELKGFGIE